MKKLLLIAILSLGVHCKAGYDLKFTNNDGSEWYYLSYVSWLTDYFDWYKAHDVVGVDHGDFEVVDGLFKIFDRSSSVNNSEKSMRDYKNLQSLINLP